jgi:hypothetical protein
LNDLQSHGARRWLGDGWLAKGLVRQHKPVFAQFPDPAGLAEELRLRLQEPFSSICGWFSVLLMRSAKVGKVPRFWCMERAAFCGPRRDCLKTPYTRFSLKNRLFS